MPPLTIGGVTVKAMEFARQPDERGGGGLRRSINGELRGRSDWAKQAYVATLLAETTSELSTIAGLINPHNSHTVAGDLMPAAITARVTLSGDVEYVRTASGWFHTVPVVIRQV